ncbi:MAG TPA: S46 family peptidase [Gemmataceae bacterium]|nr:S46 family peptidase [Gemmataceae bacterium]
MRHRLSLIAVLWLGLFCEVLTPVAKVRADEGMWLLNDPPQSLLKKKYDFDLTDAWLEHAQKASVRFNNGGSGGFVSPDGLIVTNHHIGADQLQKLSGKGKDYLRDGFLARTRARELRCPDLELNVLMSIADVTKTVNDAVNPGMKPAEAFAARRAAMARIEKESLDKTGLRSDVVTLYQGGIYHLYRYKKYTDIRLVFAPEQGIAFFGGDTDNFEFPRYNLDVCVFRAYEDDKPAKVEHYFRWASEGPKEGDLVFVTGHPGTTQRLETLARLKYRRDHSHPYTLYRLRTLEAILRQFAEQGPENARRAATDLHRVANARKAFTGQYQGLLNPAVLARKADEEKSLRARFRKADDKKSADPWQQIEEAQKKLAEFERLYLLLERGDAFFSELFGIARHVARLTAELEKPNAERLREYRDSNLESLKFQLYSPAPIYPDLEKTKLAASLSFLAENLGADHPSVKKLLAGKSPAARADELVSGTKLFDPAERRKLAEGGMKAVGASQDAMLQLALLIDDEARKLRQRFETEIEEVERQAYARIAKLRFEAFGSNVAPDATFTLRLAFGVVRGYRVDGEDLPFATTFGGAFERAERQGHREPFVLPKRWLDGKDKLDLKTPFDFVSTADTIGGNSGSPVLNRAGELIGLNFDRNRHGLVRNFVYTDEQARHIAVHGLGVLEALRKLYDAGPLVKELTGGK